LPRSFQRALALIPILSVNPLALLGFELFTFAGFTGLHIITKAFEPSGFMFSDKCYIRGLFTSLISRMGDSSRGKWTPCPLCWRRLKHQTFSGRPCNEL
jgi:hypothetical protein